MTSARAALLLWEAVRAVLGTKSGVLGKEALEWVAEFVQGVTYAEEPREKLLASHPAEFEQLVGELIPAAADDILRVAEATHRRLGCLTMDQCDGLQERLSWRSAKGEDKPDFETWRGLTATERLAFAPTIYC